MSGVFVQLSDRLSLGWNDWSLGSSKKGSENTSSSESGTNDCEDGSFSKPGEYCLFLNFVHSRILFDHLHHIQGLVGQTYGSCDHAQLS